jgi:pimeloyl-ACP methyl ester carboxylesterase
MPQTDDALFYQLYFQEPGVAEAELERDPARTLGSFLFSASGDVPRGARPASDVGMVPRNGGMLTGMVNPTSLPAWLTQADVDFYAQEFARTGFSGGLNWYRNIDRNWEFLAPFAGLTVNVPALYIAGDRDLVVAFKGMDKLIAGLQHFVPKLQRTLILPGCGHWTQQERVAEVNEAMIAFLRSALC